METEEKDTWEVHKLDKCGIEIPLTILYLTEPDNEVKPKKHKKK